MGKRKRRKGKNRASAQQAEPAAPPRRSSWRVDLALLAGLFLLMAIRFHGLFSAAELPNWDAPGHFFAVSQMAEYLQAGHLSGYLHDWLGGMELFRFYPPLFYVLVAGTWLLLFKAVPLALLFRLAAFLAVLATAISLWFFARTFVSRSVGRWALAFSAALVFYPSAYSMFGVGAGAAFWVGLIPNALGLAMVFVWLSLLERWRQAPSQGRFLLMTFAGAALVLTHTLSLIFGGILFVLWLAGNWRRSQHASRALWSLALSLALAAFWLLPFLSGLSLTAGSERGVTNSLMYLLAIFPFHIPYLEVGVVALTALAMTGTVILFKKRRVGLLAVWLGAIVIYLLRWPLSRVMPSLGIHYYRFLAVIYVLLLAMAAVGADWLWRHWAEGARRRRAYLLILAGLIAFSYFSAFDLLDRSSADEDSWRRSIPWQWQEFDGYQEAKALVAKLAEFEDLNRVHLEMPIDQALTELGSHLFFASRLPMNNGQWTSAGLFVESAPQSPFLLSTIRSLQPGFYRIWGDERLRLVKPFVDQPRETQLRRLGLFGINYLVATSDELADFLENSDLAQAVGRSGPYRIYRLPEARPLAYRLDRLPVAFLRDYGKADFRDIAMTVYAGQDSFDLPVVESGLTVNELTEVEGVSFSAVIVDGRDLAVGEANSLKLLAVPAIVLNPNEAVRSAVADGVGNLRLIERYEVVPKNTRQTWSGWPAGWTELQQALADLSWVSFIGSDSGMAALELTGERVRLAGGGPLVINSGYSERWQAANAELTVRRLTPDRLYVQVPINETVTLRYRNRGAALVGTLISLATLLGLLGFGYRRRRRNRAEAPLAE